MDVLQLQKELAALGAYAGALDGAYGPATRAAVLKALTGPGYALDAQGVAAAAAEIGAGVTAAHIRTSWAVECAGAPFTPDGRSTILPERHRFSRNTHGRFDAAHPDLSAPNWDPGWYPRTQDARYQVLLDWIGLDVDAAFESCSYGGPQILGENYRLCEAVTPFAFAWRMARSADDQLYAYVLFVKNAGLAAKLAACRPNDPASCGPFCAGYNGTAYKQNRYDQRFAAQLAVETRAAP